ncbi:hypothetical protein [Saccharopolyspora spinosa]|uniref:Uncharacterized protein n=1 Tax=Saccharopolyspora spinosa TaxID=60894 RepID=A0A2N3Y6U9_SACSN|nr:hypothetical protein [Saccharopolyspora spinosa]PKW18666.1 hypothetical protein A8926_6782 [Saccharopolyspora spinosa]
MTHSHPAAGVSAAGRRITATSIQNLVLILAAAVALMLTGHAPAQAQPTPALGENHIRAGHAAWWYS